MPEGIGSTDFAKLRIFAEARECPGLESNDFFENGGCNLGQMIVIAIMLLNGGWHREHFGRL